MAQVPQRPEGEHDQVSGPAQNQFDFTNDTQGEGSEVKGVDGVLEAGVDHRPVEDSGQKQDSKNHAEVNDDPSLDQNQASPALKKASQEMSPELNTK